MNMEFKKLVQFFLQKLFGIKIYLYCFGIYRALLKIYFPDSHLQQFISLANRKEGDILDIGSNAGTYSICFAKKMPHKYIVGFEPVNIMYHISTSLLRLFRLNNIVIRNEGLSDKIANATIVTPYQQGVYMHGLSHIDNIPEAAFENISRVEKKEIFLSTVDQYYNESGKRKIAAIKMDVENHELFVIQGASTVLHTERPIVLLELWDNDRSRACEDLMKKMGYLQMQVYGNKLAPAKSKKELNYFFIPNEFVESVNL